MLTSLDQNESKFFLTCTNWNSQSWAMRNDITNKTENMSSKLQYGMHLVACRERRQMRNYDPALDDQLGIPWKTVATAFVVVCGWSVLPMPSFTTSQLPHTAAGESVSVCQWSIPPLDQLTWTTWHYDLSLRLTSSRGQPGTTIYPSAWPAHVDNLALRTNTVGALMSVETTHSTRRPLMAAF